MSRPRYCRQRPQLPAMPSRALWPIIVPFWIALVLIIAGLAGVSR